MSAAVERLAGLPPDPGLDVYERSERAARPARVRAALAFAAFALGIGLARDGVEAPAAAWFGAACVALGAAVVLRGVGVRVALAAAMLALGGGVYAGRVQEREGGSLAPWVEELGEEALVTLRGVVAEAPRVVEARPGRFASYAPARPRARFLMVVEAAENEGRELKAGGRVWVRMQERPEGFGAGDRVRVTGMARPVSEAVNPGEADLRAWAAESGVVGTLSVPDGRLVEVLGGHEELWERARAWGLRARAAMRDRARGALEEATRGMGERERALVFGLLLGDRDPRQTEVRGAFTRIGLAHILAISGFHLTLMAGMALVVVRLTGDWGWVEPAIVAVLVGAYLLVVPAQAPVMRAGMLVLALLAAGATGRKFDRLAILIWVAIALLVWRPADLFSLGYQLSCGLTALLVWMGDRAAIRLFGFEVRGGVRRESAGEGALRWAWGWVKGSSAAALLCFAASAPLVMHRTGLLSPMAAAATVVVTIPITVLMWCAFAAMALGMAWPEAAGWMSWALRPLGEACIGLVFWFDSLPGASVRAPLIGAAWAGAATLLAVYWFARGWAGDRRAWVGLAVVAAWWGAEAFWPARARDAVRMDVLAVGDGSCVLLRSGEDAVLWNCGGDAGIGVNLVPRAARELGVWRTPVAVVTRPELSRFAGLLDAAEPLGVRTVLVDPWLLMQAEAGRESAPGVLVEELRRRGVEVAPAHAGVRVRLGRAELRIVSPEADAPLVAVRDHGVMAVVEFPGMERAAIVLAEDATAAGVQRLLAREPALRAEAALVPGATALDRAMRMLVDGLQPRVVVESVRRARDRGMGEEWWSTGRDGAVWVEVEPGGSVRRGSVRGP